GDGAGDSRWPVRVGNAVSVESLAQLQFFEVRSPGWKRGWVMSGYEHLMTLGSFVIALGIGSILNFAAVLAHHRRPAKISATPLFWVASILFNQMAFWLGCFLFHNESHADIYMLSYVVISPILLYAQGALAVTDGRETMDLVAHNERNKHIYLTL